MVCCCTSVTIVTTITYFQLVVTTQVWEVTHCHCSQTDAFVGFNLGEKSTSAAFTAICHKFREDTSSAASHSWQSRHWVLRWAHSATCWLSDSTVPIQLHPEFPHLTETFPSDLRTKRSGKYCGRKEMKCGDEQYRHHTYSWLFFFDPWLHAINPRAARRNCLS